MERVHCPRCSIGRRWSDSQRVLLSSSNLDSKRTSSLSFAQAIVPRRPGMMTVSLRGVHAMGAPDATRHLQPLPYSNSALLAASMLILLLRFNAPLNVGLVSFSQLSLALFQYELYITICSSKFIHKFSVLLLVYKLSIQFFCCC